jgi:two-component system cell cycle response regulator
MSDSVPRMTTLLVVEREPVRIDALREHLRNTDEGTRLDGAGDLAGALERLSTGGVDAVILDPDLPDSQGIVTFERMHAFAPNVPVIVMTSEGEDDLAVRAVQGGAQDCMREEEAEPSVLFRSVRYAIERHRLLAALRSLSLIDGLTDLYNRRGFNDLGEQYLKLALRSSQPVSLICLDIDRFKTINKTLGHHVGDRALLCVADMLRDTFRRSDIVARMTGDEFAVLAFETSAENAETLVGRLVAELAELNDSPKERFQLSLSVGLARHDGGDTIALDELLRRAAEAMHEEKNGKRRALTP